MTIARLLEIGGFLKLRFFTLDSPSDVSGGDDWLRPDLAADLHLIVTADFQGSGASQVRSRDENRRHGMRHDLAAERDVDSHVLIDERLSQEDGRTDPVWKVLDRLFSAEREILRVNYCDRCCMPPLGALEGNNNNNLI